jgi:hypothetical protein
MFNDSEARPGRTCRSRVKVAGETIFGRRGHAMLHPAAEWR